MVHRLRADWRGFTNADKLRPSSLLRAKPGSIRRSRPAALSVVVTLRFTREM